MKHPRSQNRLHPAPAPASHSGNLYAPNSQRAHLCVASRQAGRSNIDRINLAGSILQHAIRKAAGGGANIHANFLL